MYLFECSCGTKLLLIKKILPICRNCDKQMKRNKKKVKPDYNPTFSRDFVNWFNNFNGN